MIAVCRICGRPYQHPPVGPADYRCPVCLAAGRYWRAAQLGTRAQIYIRSRASAFHGETGIGERVSTPEDGWMCRLLSGGRAMFFGCAAVAVDFEIGPGLQVERGIWAATRSFRLAATRRTGKDPAPSPLARFPRTG